MGRQPRNKKYVQQGTLKKGAWTAEEDQRLVSFIRDNMGHGSWRTLPKLAGLDRCGKSCRLRWINYLRPNIKRGNFSEEEQRTIVHLHGLLGNKWSSIASHLEGRTDNEIKNHWNTHLKKRLARMGIDPTTHLPFDWLLQSQNYYRNLYYQLKHHFVDNDEWRREFLKHLLQVNASIMVEPNSEKLAITTNQHLLGIQNVSMQRYLPEIQHLVRDLRNSYLSTRASTLHACGTNETQSCAFDHMIIENQEVQNHFPLDEPKGASSSYMDKTTPSLMSNEMIDNFCYKNYVITKDRGAQRIPDASDQSITIDSMPNSDNFISMDTFPNPLISTQETIVGPYKDAILGSKFISRDVEANNYEDLNAPKSEEFNIQESYWHKILNFLSLISYGGS
ncbi:hypothetical protein KP509_20G074500 [Ceratopteris richardii]|uniref:Uncharacterized protein n=1 Tax=Ceratopteris richardii TaxID=49495 RepID=A0A8T2SI62_CERRI|nr:hypothetical protein KP509_20G074500 [Ceratopteris richardii]